MNMPEELQRLIQDFARPRLRPDWRTCKTQEAIHVKTHLETAKHLHQLKINDIFQDGWIAHCILREIHSWTLYGLRKVIREPPGWTARLQETPNPLLPEWYLHMYLWVVCGDPRWHWIDGEWILEPM